MHCCAKQSTSHFTWTIKLQLYKVLPINWQVLLYHRDATLYLHAFFFICIASSNGLLQAPILNLSQCEGFESKGGFMPILRDGGSKPDCSQDLSFSQAASWETCPAIFCHTSPQRNESNTLGECCVIRVADIRVNMHLGLEPSC